MELYIGGVAQGKLALAKEKYPNAKVFDENNAEEITREKDAVIWDRFHLSVRIWLEEGRNLENVMTFIEQAISQHPELVIIADEVSCGFEPEAGFEKSYQETLGGILITIAEKATSVTRVVCGIPQKIK